MPQRPQNTVCIACGLVVGEPPRLNRLQNGQTCPACRERVLDAVPAALPSLHRSEASLEDSDVMPLFERIDDLGDPEIDGPPPKRSA